MDSGSASGVGGWRSAMGDADSNSLTFPNPPGMTERRVTQGIGDYAVPNVNDPNSQFREDATPIRGMTERRVIQEIGGYAVQSVTTPNCSTTPSNPRRSPVPVIPGGNRTAAQPVSSTAHIKP